jgi:CubicO group peptidase (beta-lactamase class C family)
MSNLEAAIRRLDRYIEMRMLAANTPGMAITVTDRENLMHLSTYGFSDVAAQAPVTKDTLFEIGSISKSFTSVALMQLREEGMLDLHEPVSRYLPWFDVGSEHGPITLHHLMSHSAGIIMGMEFTGEARYEVWSLRETEATASPGSYYHYSNVGYKTLGVILEDILSKPYGEIIQESILDPLGMTSTDPIITHETRKRMAVGYEAFYDDRPPARNRPLAPATWLEFRWGDGSVASTPADMAAYVRMYLNRGQGPEGAVLSEESLILMMEPVIEAVEEGDDSFYGYGLDIYEIDGHKTIGHGGGMVGYYAYILADMHDGLGVVVLTNGPGSKTDEIAKFAIDLFRAELSGRDLPPIPQVDPTKIKNANEYVGIYENPHDQMPDLSTPTKQMDVTKTFSIVAEGEQLYINVGDERILLEKRESDYFHADHPEFAYYLLGFGREDGGVVEAFFGSDWYVNERYQGPKEFDYPTDWDAYPGHYRSHNPWDTNFRVVLRKGKLILIYPFGENKLLVPVNDGEFRVGEDELSPERIRFDVIIDGQALYANFSCGEYYRTSKF